MAINYFVIQRSNYVITLALFFPQLLAMSMGSCDKLSTNYEILDDRHIVFEDEDAFDMCAAHFQNMFLREDADGHQQNEYLE